MARADDTPRLVLGTAGHIDHGKTALIRALTGTDTDRLPEEKARGITIELGFAALALPGGIQLSVVDVPGHERLVRTMVSGATGIDLVLLVIAADEGVMPQTREHVAICDLLGMRRGVVALSKTDLADPEMREIAELEVQELLAPTGLADAPIVPVSTVTGEGLDELKAALARTATASPPCTPRLGAPRLGIDRAFAVRGFGAVVTGTLVGGSLSVGQTVEIHPGGLRARIRGLQSFGESTPSAQPGVRCAVNLQGLELAQLETRELLTEPDRLAPTHTADVRLHWLPGAPAGGDRASVEFLVGTATRRARVSPIGGGRLAPGWCGFARMHVEGEAMALLPGDRFILRGFARTESGGATLGGGVVLDAHPPHRRLSEPSLLRELEIFDGGDVQEMLVERVARVGLAGVPLQLLALESGLEKHALRAQLEELERRGAVLQAGTKRWLSAKAVIRLEQRLCAATDAFHARHPLRPGMPRGALRGQLPENVCAEAAELALSRLAAAGQIRIEEQRVRRANFVPHPNAEDRALLEDIEQEAQRAGLEPPSPRDWADRLGLTPDRFRELVAFMEREHTLIRAPGDLWFARAAVHALRDRVIAHLREHETLDTPTYKTLIATTRRTAVPLMELLDELHITHRVGDVRILRKGFES